MNVIQSLFDGIVSKDEEKAYAQKLLHKHHYLGPRSRGNVFVHELGVIVYGAPTSRRLPKDWIELSRWCLPDSAPNAGTSMFADYVGYIRRNHPYATTIVSYSDPSAGHDGALYRACNWLWAPTWQRLRPPPSGGGKWTGAKNESVKDRWVYLLRPDSNRENVLRISDSSVRRKWPFASYVEPAWRRGKPVLVRQNEGFKRWKAESIEVPR